MPPKKKCDAQPAAQPAAHSVQPYIDYHRQPYSRFISMNEYNKRFNTMLFDPMVEQQIKEQHRITEDYQHFKLERTDLLSSEERLRLYK